MRGAKAMLLAVAGACCIAAGALAAEPGTATGPADPLELLKHHDAEFKVFSRVLSRVLFFDPFSKFFDPAVHREREYLADEASGRTTGKPTSLAAALLKLAGTPAPAPSAWGLSIWGPGGGLFNRYPPIRERVQRLLLLSDLLRGGSNREKQKPIQ